METTTKPKTYKVEMKFNGLTFKKRSKDLNATILAMKPEILYTEMYVTVSNGKSVMERILNLKQGRNLFINDDFREIFINNLMLK